MPSVLVIAPLFYLLLAVWQSPFPEDTPLPKQAITYIPLTPCIFAIPEFCLDCSVFAFITCSLNTCKNRFVMKKLATFSIIAMTVL